MVRRPDLVTLAAVAAAAWVARWGALEVAAYLHRAYPRPAPSPRDMQSPPGAMPVPPDA